MKLLASALVVLSLVGCASSRPQGQGRAMTYEQLSAIQVKNSDCRNIDAVVNNMETQLRLKGLTNANPEDLNDADRKYNATARIVIWSMRIGCNNPNRYRS
jgi:hypothetical protein